MKKFILGMAALLVIAGAGCAGQQATESTTSSSQTEAEVPETPPPSDIAALSNPLGVTPQTIAAGQALYNRSCWVCHGINGNGEGPAANGLEQEPINFTSDRDFQTMNDGEVYWIIRKGVEGTAMPSWEGTFSENELWQLQAYIIQFREDPNDRTSKGTAGTTTSSEPSGGTTSSSEEGGATTSEEEGGGTSTSE